MKILSPTSFSERWFAELFSAANTLLMLTAAYAFGLGGPAAAQFVPIFNGSNLDGWHTVGGSGTYHVENSEIVGLSNAGSPNTFLVTNTEYDDFILEADFKISDTTFNSGIQLRSHTLPTHNNGQLFGYQVEIDPSSRAWTGGIYFEGGSPNRPAGWLDDLADNPAAQAAFVLGEWNHFRIAALGHRITTWINGVPAADFFDADSAAFLPTGVIGLQVHANTSQVPLEVRWRNLLVDEQTPGDFNGDNSINLQDYLILSANLHTDVSSLEPLEAYLKGDINGDQHIDFGDLVAFRNGYPTAASTSAQLVPEPSMPALVILLNGVTLACGRRSWPLRATDRPTEDGR